MRLIPSSGRGRSPLGGCRTLSFLLCSTLLLNTLCQADQGQKSQDAACASTEFRCDCGVPKCVDKSLVKNGAKDCADGSDEGEWDPSKCAIKNRTSEDIRFKRAAVPELGYNKDATTTFFSHDRARTRPVGLLSTSLGAFVTSGTTTEYLTKVLGTYIKGTYARIISTSSKVYHAVPTDIAAASDRPTGFITSTKSTEIHGYATTVHATDFYRTYIDGTYAQIVSSSSDIKYPSWYTDRIEASSVPISPSSVADGRVYPTVLPTEVRGSFQANVDSSKAYAEVGIVTEDGGRPGTLKLFRPANPSAANELRVTGTHGKFVNSAEGADPTTYNVFTGSYLQNSKTFLFFFGNTVIAPSSSGGVTPPPTLTVESGHRPENNVMVDLSRNLHVVVPSANSRVKVEGSVGGERMTGVLVEIEGSEEASLVVDGAEEMGGTPLIDSISMTLGGVKESVSSSSSSSRGREQDNEIPQGRKVPDSISPSRAEQLSLPTFTVGQPDVSEVEVSPNLNIADMLVEGSTKNPVRLASSPVFHKVSSERPPARSMDRIRALGYTQKKLGGLSSSSSNLNGKYPMPNRAHRAFSAFDAGKEDNDLTGAASTGRATVTYVGFADFTTTVGNTVIVFMPRTKMIEDISVHASKTRDDPSSERIQPTRYVYTTEPDASTTTESSGDDDDHVAFSVSSVQGRKVEGSSKRVTLDEDEETTTELAPSVVSTTGRETILFGKKPKSGNSSSVQTPKVRPSSSAGRNSLFSSPRVKFTPKASRGQESASSSIYQTASTAVFQTDVLNPTGLVTSVDGTLVKDGTTTVYTSLVFGTFIGKSYAQVIKSTSSVVKASATPTSPRSIIRPTSVVKLPSKSKSLAPVYYEFSTTTQSSADEDDATTTTTSSSTSSSTTEGDRMEVSVSTTTEKARDPTTEAEELVTTPINLQDSFDDEDDYTSTSTTTTTTEKEPEFDNEIGQKRKVSGKAKDQIIVDLEPSQVDGEDPTIYVTRTLPTTVYRTYTYYTTFFIPEEGSTSTKIVSREVTSSAVGLVRKTFTNVNPTAAQSEEVDVKPSVKPARKFLRGKDGGSQVIYKTLFTTYTYLTTFFSGSTSSVASREETVSNIVTITSDPGASFTTKPSSTLEITPTSSSSAVLRSRTGYKTISPRVSSGSSSGSSVGGPGRSRIPVGSHTPNLGVSSSSSSVPSRTRGRASTVLRSKVPSSSSTLLDDDRATDEIEYQSVTKTLLRTFMTTYTYFTTLFNGEDTSIKSRTEVITNVVPYVTKTLAPILPSVPPTSAEADYSEEPKSKVKETTFYTTYTYLSTIFKGKTSSIKTSKQTYTNIIVGEATIRSGYVGITPTSLSGRSVTASATRTPKQSRPLSSLNDVDGEEVDEYTTLNPGLHPEYELEGSEDVGITTNRPDSYDANSLGDDEDNDVINREKTPLLKTLFTTYTFYTTYYKGGSSAVSSRLETKSQVVTDTVGLDDEDEVAITDKAPLLSSIDPTYPVTYFTTYTYWTTSFKDGSSIVTSREETVTNIATPSVVTPSTSADNEILPTSTQTEVELTTFYTTYTYFTTSYLGEKTVVNSRLETVTNVITGSVGSVPTPTQTQTGRAIGTVKAGEQKISGNEKDEYEDYATGLLSSIVSSTVNQGTTTVFSTDVFGTLIDGIYAQVLESTSKIVQPTAAAFTRFFPEATSTPTGVVSVNEGKTVEAGADKTTYYATTAYGTVIDGKYAHLVESTSSIKESGSKTLAADPHKTGLVRVIDGTLVEGDHTTFYTSSILGTFVDGQYAQVIESTSRTSVNLSPTRASGEEGKVGKTVFVDVESSVTESSGDDEDGVTTTTEKTSSEEVSTEKPSKIKGIIPPRRFGANRDRSPSSRLSYTGTTKTVAPSITPFASRSRPSGFSPRKRTSAAILPSKTVSEESSSSSSSVPSRGFSSSKKRFQKPGGDSNNANADGTTTPTPALPASRSRGNGRFTKPVVGGKSRFEKSSAAASISPSSVGGGASSSPGARGRSSFAPRGSSVPGRSRSSAVASPARASSSSIGGTKGFGAVRFVPGKGRTSISPSATQTATVTPTASGGEEYEGEYEYESGSSSTTSTTPEPPSSSTTRGRGGPNRFRLSNKLSTPSAGSVVTSTSRPTTRGSPLNLRRFSKPTIPTRATTPAPVVSDGESPKEGEYDEEYEGDLVVPASSTTTVRPARASFGSKKIIPATTPRATTRPVSRGRATTTPPVAVAQTTTRRIYTPRPRPAGFPKAVGPLARSTTSTTPSPLADDEYYEEGEFEYQETKHVPRPGNVTSTPALAVVPLASPLLPAGSELSEVRVPPPASFTSLLDSFLTSFGQEQDQAPEPVTRRKRSTYSRQVSPAEYALLTGQSGGSNLYYNYGARTSRATLRSNFPSRPTSGGSSSGSNLNHNSKPNSRSSGQNSDYEYEYMYETDEQPAPPPPPPPPSTPPPRQSPSARFRGRIQPTPASTSSPPSRRTPFTLTPNTNSRPSPPSRSRSRTPTSTSSNTPSRPFLPARPRSSSSSRGRVTERPTTTSRTSRFRNRYNSRDSATTPAPILTRGSSNSASSRFGSSLITSRSRGGSSPINNPVNNDPHPWEPTTITITHYIPAETSIPFVNGKSTEYKTVVTPSPSLEIVAPYQYTTSEYLGKPVLVLNSESTANPSPGATEITRFIVRESPTTSVTFTPTTIRGRKTSFSHIVPSTVYSVEPVVSTISGPLSLPGNNNELTNLLLNQLLGQGLLNPANLLALQGGQPSNLAPSNPNEPVTQYNTKTTSYVTTVTDFTSTIVKITLHGKPLKSTLVESSTHIITATEFITESTVISPTLGGHLQNTQVGLQPLQLPNNNNLLLQNLLQLQQQQLLAQNPILPTASAQLTVTQTASLTPKEDDEPKTKTARKVPETPAPPPPPPPKPASSVITLYVSGKNPGEFSTVLQTVAITESRRKRDVEPTRLGTGGERDEENEVDSFDKTWDNWHDVRVTAGGQVELEDSYSYSDPYLGGSRSSSDIYARPTDSLESVLGQSISQFVSRI